MVEEVKPSKMVWLPRHCRKERSVELKGERFNKFGRGFETEENL
jgi:hypothetical protein